MQAISINNFNSSISFLLNLFRTKHASMCGALTRIGWSGEILERSCDWTRNPPIFFKPFFVKCLYIFVVKHIVEFNRSFEWFFIAKHLFSGVNLFNSCPNMIGHENKTFLLHFDVWRCGGAASNKKNISLVRPLLSTSLRVKSGIRFVQKRRPAKCIQTQNTNTNGLTVRLSHTQFESLSHQHDRANESVLSRSRNSRVDFTARPASVILKKQNLSLFQIFLILILFCCCVVAVAVVPFVIL